MRAFVTAILLLSVTAAANSQQSFAPRLILKIPPPPPAALSGSQFVRFVERMNPRDREQAILRQILDGDLPEFLRKLAPVDLRYQAPTGAEVTATIFVMPEYLAIGSRQDFLRIPMNLPTAAAVATRMGFILPTRRMVDAIYQQSTSHFSPEPMTPGPQMRSTNYYRIHNEKIEAQARSIGIQEGSLVAGHKKDVVLTGLLRNSPERIAIYGWQRLSGNPIQPLSTVHGACYVDYSHGIRLVSEIAIVNGATRSIYDLLKDPILSRLVSDEGPIPDARDILLRAATSTLCGNPAI